MWFEEVTVHFDNDFGCDSSELFVSVLPQDIKPY